ncbi:ABC transporter substrate-binding protein [Planomicrobium sp. Y74]|uniref:ABC transporter substrate-binding protein n=1 Tax=Planomicrobium sp. Y74 TaxID=2478977 RepID=UPI000EF4F207|nr:ABC transporter substrate-binding protein [Planomicrobium sp. Y74]RLQ92771.1 ABC transporter substrate-binding protein [Planomicrobium sp. Y74]
MEKHLLTLWKTIPSGNVKHKEIASILGFSTKQTTRYIKKWTAQGWFSYTAGRGRGNFSKLLWLKNVEEIYEEQLMKIIEQEAVEESSKYLLYDWTSESKLRLLNQFRSKFGYFQSAEEVDKLIIPRKYPLLTLHPIEALDIQSAHMVANVFNRLVAVDENGVITPELAHAWDVQDTRLRFYLHKDVKFHDGSLLTAEDVVTCMNRLRNHPYFKTLWEPVMLVKAVAPLVVDFHFPGGCSYCLQMLGMMNTSIYKESKGKVFGTGGFYEAENVENKTSLKAFSDYFQKRPLLDVIDFVQVPKDFDIVYRSASQEKEETTFQVESDTGFGVVIMNAFRPSPIQRQEVRDYVHYVITKHRKDIGHYHKRALPNSKSCLIGHSQEYTVQEVKRPHIEEPLVLKAVEDVDKAAIWLKDALEEEGVPVKMQWMSYADKLLDHGEDQQADLFIHGEVLEINQDFSFYYFFKNSNSPLAANLAKNKQILAWLNQYSQTPFEDWNSLNLQIEKMLLESSIMVPLYYEKRQIPFSADLMNIKISHFGYVDFSTLWVKPVIKE